MISLSTTAIAMTDDAPTDAGGGEDENIVDGRATEAAKQETRIIQQIISTNNPITDIVKESNAITVTTTATAKTAAVNVVGKQKPELAPLPAAATENTTPPLISPSKIPYLQQQHTSHVQDAAYGGKQLKQLLHTLPDPFRRSASLRMRGKKSNLYNIYTNGQRNLTMEHNTRSTPTTKARKYPLTGVVPEIQQQQPQQHDIHDVGHTNATGNSSLFGGAAARYKPAVASTFGGSTLTKQSPTFTVGNLTRSQSLRRSLRNYHNVYRQQNCFKTDTIKEQNSGGATIIGTEAVGIGAAIGRETSDNVAPLKSKSQNAQLEPAADSENCVVPNGKMQENDIMYGKACEDGGLGEQRSLEKHIQKMSLNLNGSSSSGGERSITPTKSLISQAGAPNTGTPTGSGSGRRIATVSTPKTPNNTTAASFVHYIKSSRIVETQETKLTPKIPPVTPDSPCTYLDDDLDSMYSFATTTSGRSTMSCEHPYVARNGTTFSGRKMKYVVHCSNYAGQVGPDYLTPTQRASRQIRRLKELLCLARQDLEQKDSEILRLTREVVELRLFKASLSSPEERSASSEAVTVREAELKTSQDVSPIIDMVDDATKSSPRHIPNHVHSQHLQQQQAHQLSSEMQSSFADSGHFEDLSVHSKDSYAAHTQDMACGSDETIAVGDAEGCAGAAGSGVGNADDADDNEDYAVTIKNYELQRQELIRIYEQKIEELIRTQDGASSEMKRSHNDKVEALLQKLAECNTRYADIVPDYEHAKERIRELERQLEDLQRKLAEHEDKQNKMYLHMYQKGQEAERIARADQALELAHRAPTNKVSINELLQQLQSTQDELENIRTIYRRLLEAQKNRTHVDPEVTLQFLKSAIYYFLTDKENSQGHLQAIESILEFTDTEKQNINKARLAK
ncbi:protein quick-to-court isoform X2 [Eurosta solidaginis]|uniref:protein quick-to-court isoform X2 n=1 Tax=Eurosta solidaginis TaxID=178769 RepID=UPI003531767C